MTNLLTDAIREAFASDKDKSLAEEANTTFTHNTGIKLLDYKLGRRVYPQDHESYCATGIDEGNYIMMIGKSGSGKTTCALQMAINIVKDYQHSQIFHDDLEQATNDARVRAMSKWSVAEMKQKYIKKTSGITSESFYKRIKYISDTKQKLRDQIEIETDKVDLQGNPIKILPPTVFLLDSLPLLVPEKIADEDELSGQMSQTAVAKANAAIFRRIMPLLKKSNIILIVVNHITQKVEINPMVHTKPQINYLKQDESIPGGNTPLYLANTLLRLDPGSKLTDDKEFGINGFKNTLTIIKSRSNRAGQTMDLIFDQVRGVDNILSLYQLLKDEKLVNTGSFCSLKSCPDVKFRQKDFKKKLQESKELRLAFLKDCDEILNSFIPEFEDLEEDYVDDQEVEEVEYEEVEVEYDEDGNEIEYEYEEVEEEPVRQGGKKKKK